MAKRGRKPKERKGYFYEEEENAIVKYINETNQEEKNKIFNSVLYPALTKMIESIIRRYKLFVPDEEFDQNFSDTISYLLTKINHFKPSINVYEEIENPSEDVKYSATTVWDSNFHVRAEDEDPKYIKVCWTDDEDYQNPVEKTLGYYKKVEKHYKAYSYCGTVCKNYLMYKCSQYAKKRQRNTPYDEVFEEISNSERYMTNDETYSDVAIRLVKSVANEIETMIKNRDEYELTDEEVIVGNALINLLRNWEDVLPSDGSNKLQKSSVLYFLREETMMTTKEVRDNMKKFKSAFLVLKKIELEDR
jgi:hypothetical protein